MNLGWRLADDGRGHAMAAPPRRAMNSRRFIDHLIGWRRNFLKEFGTRAEIARTSKKRAFTHL
jgi:hypothetical protein